VRVPVLSEKIYSIWPSSSTRDEVRQRAGVSVLAWYLWRNDQRRASGRKKGKRIAMGESVRVQPRAKVSSTSEKDEHVEIGVDELSLLILDDLHSDDESRIEGKIIISSACGRQHRFKRKRKGCIRNGDKIVIQNNEGE
jgi:NDP-sugar pyrophosphorylase family protein